MVFTTQLRRENQVGYSRVRSLSMKFRSFSLVFFFFNFIFCSPSMMGFSSLTIICSSVVFVDKRHVAPRLNLVNVANLNRVLRSEVFVSEDRQLRAVHLILDFLCLLDSFQEVGHAIRAGGPRLRRIDVSIPGFLAREDIVPVGLPPVLLFLKQRCRGKKLPPRAYHSRRRQINSTSRKIKRNKEILSSTFQTRKTSLIGFQVFASQVW